jgi:peroxiredoxin/outer membrane lipoprotein-sorting protein
MQMKNRTKTWTIVVAAALALEAWALYVVSASPARWRPGLIVKDEPAARALYNKMTEVLRETGSLSYTSMCSGPDGRVCKYQVMLKKPHGCLVQVVNEPSVKTTTLLADADHLWIYWSGTRPYLTVDDYGDYEETRSNVYIRREAPAGQHAVRDEIASLGLAWYAPVLDPTTFHGHADPFDAHIDGVRGRGTHLLGDELCDIIEITYMNAQRTRHIWLSREDHLPRRVKEIVRRREIHVHVEEWSDIVINPDVRPEELTWSPPEGCRQWRPPSPEGDLLQAGQEAPDFELRSPDERPVKLLDYHGKVVWLFFWQTGSPPCRRAMPWLQALHEKQSNDDLAIIGFNHGDDERIARAFLRESAITFPTIVDPSAAADQVMAGYGNEAGRVPLTYIVDRQGLVVDAWFGYEQGDSRLAAALERAGLESEGF